MADFPYLPDFSYEIESNYNVLRTKFENQSEQRRLKSSKKLRKLRLVFENRSTAEKVAVIAFFDDKFGSLTSFTIAIEGEDILGIFAPGSFRHTRIAPEVYAYQFDFEEVVS